MKGTRRNWECSVQNRRAAKSLNLSVAFAALVAVAALVCLSGCSSARGGGDFEPGVYNPNTGYPAIGGGTAWHM